MIVSDVFPSYDSINSLSCEIFSVFGLIIRGLSVIQGNKDGGASRYPRRARTIKSLKSHDLHVSHLQGEDDEHYFYKTLQI